MAETVTFNFEQVPGFATLPICVQGGLEALSTRTYDDCPSPESVASAPVLVGCICNNNIAAVSSVLSVDISFEYNNCNQADIDLGNSVFTSNCALNARSLGTTTSSPAITTGTGVLTGAASTNAPANSALLFTPSPTSNPSTTGLASTSSSGSALSETDIIAIAVAGAVVAGFVLSSVALAIWRRYFATRRPPDHHHPEYPYVPPVEQSPYPNTTIEMDSVQTGSELQYQPSLPSHFGRPDMNHEQIQTRNLHRPISPGSSVSRSVT